MRLKKVIILIVVLIIQTSYTHANTSISIGYQAKYRNFDNFDYVNSEATKGGEITISAFGTFDSLNPFLLKSLSPAQINNLMFDTLMTRSLDEPSSSYSLLAKAYQLADDKLSVNYYIDENARFKNGDQVTAYDVKFSFDLLLSEKAHPQYRIYWNDVESAETLDAFTVKFNFKRRNPELHLILGDLPVFSKKWLSKSEFPSSVKKIPITSGPYTISDYSIGKYIIYERNQNYWAQNIPTRRHMYNFDRIMIKYYKDMTVALEAFKAGEYDYIHENHSKRWARDYEGPNFTNNKIIKTELLHSNNTGIQGFAFNTRNKIFKDINDDSKSAGDVIKENGKFDLQIIVTGSHLLESHGNSYTEILDDGFLIDKKVEMYIDDLEANGTDVSAWVQSWDDVSGNDTNRGRIRISKANTLDTWMVFKVTGAITDASGYSKISLVYIDTAGTFANEDKVFISFVASGEDGAIPGYFYKFDTGTSDTDPGAGEIAFNNGTYASATEIYIDDADANGASTATDVQSWGSSTSTIKGFLHIVDINDSSTYARFKITAAVTDASGYNKITVEHLASNNTFSAADELSVHFTRT